VHETPTFLLVTLPNTDFIFFTDRLSNKPFLIRTLTTLPNLKYVTPLPCNLSIIACFLTLMFSQGSVAIYVRSGWIFNNQFTANLPRNLTAINFVNRLRFDRIMSTSLWPHFFGLPCIICINRPHASRTAYWQCGPTVADPGTGRRGDEPSPFSLFCPFPALLSLSSNASSGPS